MTAAEIVGQLEPLGLESYRKVLFNHGAREPVLGIKIEELKKYQRTIKKDHRLALELFDTGIYDAQYLAGLIADERAMTTDDLRRWLTSSNCSAIAVFAVAWVAAEGPHARELALEWIDSADERASEAGWATLSSWVAVRDDSQLDLTELRRLLDRVERTIHTAPNGARRAMNGFVIALGSYVRELTDEAIAAGERIGTVYVDMGNTACKVPSAPDYIRKVQQRGTIGKKRKTARC
jgi:3-methyladenine DNA glycosylase AlkD